MEAIWFGRKATGLRKRLMSDDSACRSCDYYRFALCEESIDLNDPKMHFAEPLVPWVDRVNFDTGEAEVEQQVRPPRLLGSVGRINLVAYGSRYYGLPQELGPVQLEREDVSRLRGVITAESLETLKQRILEPV
jgi:hypothetical protein